VPHHSGRTTGLSMIRALAQGLQLSKSFVHICHDRATTSSFPPNNYEPPMASRPMGCCRSARANATTRRVEDVASNACASTGKRIPQTNPSIHPSFTIGMNPLSSTRCLLLPHGPLHSGTGIQILTPSLRWIWASITVRRSYITSGGGSIATFCK
jgi:hypothetical protein